MQIANIPLCSNKVWISDYGNNNIKYFIERGFKFSETIPVPLNIIENGKEWKIENWGTRDNMCNVKSLVVHDSSREYYFECDTILTPPISALGKFCIVFDTEITLKFQQNENKINGVIVIKSDGTFEQQTNSKQSDQFYDNCIDMSIFSEDEQKDIMSCLDFDEKVIRAFKLLNKKY